MEPRLYFKLCVGL